MLELVSSVSGKARFPLPVGRDYSEKGLGILKTKPPLVVPGFTTFHRVLLSLCKLGASMGNPW